MQRQYDIRVNQGGKSDTSDVSSGMMRVGLLFGSLALALGLVLVPVYMKRDSDKLIDTQYQGGSGGVITAIGAH